jgi:hypothetical protein
MATGEHKSASRRERQKMQGFATVTINHEIEAILLDLSNTGLKLQTTNPFRPGTSIYVSFLLPDSFHVVEGEATVVWSDANGQAGVKFLDDEMQRIIDGWLEKAAKKAKRKSSGGHRRPTVH